MNDRTMEKPYRIPLPVWIIAALAAIIHIAPYLRAELQTPPGWRFTGVLYASPDLIPYRVWLRQTQEMGILVDNKFTIEPNSPHLLMLSYYGFGKIAQWTHIAPEHVFVYAGSFLAFGFALTLFLLIRIFIPSPYQATWVLAITLFGGGLGAHLKALSALPIKLLQGMLSAPLQEAGILESNRGGYIVDILFDTHFILIWLLATASILAYRYTLSRFSGRNVLLTAVLFSFSTLVHLYEGITLLMISAAITLVCLKRRVHVLPVIITTVVCAFAIVVTLLTHILLYKSAGLPVSPWRPPSPYFSTLLLSFPVAWLVIFQGWATFRNRVTLNECFVTGWVLGCLVLVLSGPFNPYPGRGRVTLQIALYIMAGMIYFRRHQRVSPNHAVIAILLLCATPIWSAIYWKNVTTFRVEAPQSFENHDHRELINFLKARASSNDILLNDKSMPGWESDDLWIYPEYPGKFYCGHFFLTVKFDVKRQRANQFFASMNPQQQQDFLHQNRIRFLFVENKRDPLPLLKIPGVVMLKQNSAGSILEFVNPIADSRSEQ